MKRNTVFFLLLLSLPGFLSIRESTAQGMGQALAFQGLPGQMNRSVKAVALGGAYIAQADGINAIFYNPAGLVGATQMQLSLSYNRYFRKSYERQQFGPQGGSWGILELIFAGYYTPHPEDDGIPSNRISYDLSEFRKPEVGVEYFSEKYAQWINSSTGSGLNNVAVAVPARFLKRDVVLGFAYANQTVYDFDRNNHILGIDGKTDARRRPLNNDWYKYLRNRSGTLHLAAAAVAYRLNARSFLGARLQYLSGKTDDFLLKNRFAHYDILTTVNVYTLWHDHDTLRVAGESNYHSLQLNLGGIYQTKEIAVGAAVAFPFTLKRDYSYHRRVVRALSDSSLAVTASDSSGFVKMRVPFSATFGFSVRPTQKFVISFDYEMNFYKRASYQFSNQDTTFFFWKWPNQFNVHFGLEYKPFSFLSLMAGYVYKQELIRPWDHFRMDVQAPTSDVYTAGISLKLPLGILDAAFVYNVFHYIDYYDFHKDYSTIQRKNILVGYTLTF